jgi:hypothetical protein
MLPGSSVAACAKEIVMPVQKDLKRLVRARMKKTGEAYTAARLQLLKKNEPPPKYAELARMSDSVMTVKTGRSWAKWDHVLDRERAWEKRHREIALFVSSLGTPDWWTQTVTVGYERIKGLRDKRQRRGGAYEASKNRTSNTPIEKLFDAFANDRTRRRWLGTSFTVRSLAPLKRMRVTCDDNTGRSNRPFDEGPGESAVAVQHQKLRESAAVDGTKKAWAERFDRLGEILIRSAQQSG